MTSIYRLVFITYTSKQTEDKTYAQIQTTTAICLRENMFQYFKLISTNALISSCFTQQ